MFGEDRLDRNPLVTVADEAKRPPDAIFAERGIKLGHTHENAERVAALGRALIEHGASAVIAGCTEIGLVLTGADYPVIDPLSVLAAAVVRQVKGDA